MDHVFHVSFPGMGIENLRIDRVVFSVFGMNVYWYGLLISFALILVLFLAVRSAPKYNIKPDHIMDTVLWVIPFMIVFARLYYVLFSLSEFQGDFLSIFNLRTGGLGFYGGVIGGIIALILVVKIKKNHFSQMMDFLIVYVPLGHGIGRWGNFFNQEAFGTNTSLPWGMISEGTSEYLRITGTGDPLLPVHPTFLYEFLANMALFAILLAVRSKSRRPYETTVFYLIGYGLVRFFVESIRTDALFIGETNIRISMVVSALMVAGGILALFLIRIRPVSQDLSDPSIVPPEDHTIEKGQ
jgi:phosphatidylglycerol---prolipoprotein diacylglyceryl transferase